MLNRFIIFVSAALLINTVLIYSMELSSFEEFISEVPNTLSKTYLADIGFNKEGKNILKYVKVREIGISLGEKGEAAPKQSSHEIATSPIPPKQTFEIDDKREMVSTTGSYPFRCFGQLESYQGKRKYGGSAILIGPHHALTAAHNVYDLEDKSWRTKIILNFGRQGDIAIEVSTISRAYIPESYVKDHNHDFDIALLVLDRPVGRTIGWLGCLFTTGDRMFSEEDINVTGYPSDKGFKNLYTMANKAIAVKGERVFYQIYTSVGNSGSPIWMLSETDHGKQPVIIGIHTHGEGEKGSGNSGVRLTEKKFKQIIDWINETREFDVKASDQQMKQQFTNHDLLLMGKAAYSREDYSKAVNCFERIELQQEDSFEKAYAGIYQAKMYLFGKAVTKSMSKCVEYCQNARKFLISQRNAPQEMKDLLAVIKEMTNSSPVDALIEIPPADVVKDIRSKQFTRICLAAQEGNLELVMLLKEKGASWKIDGCSTTPLHCAVQNGHSTIVEYLLKQGFDAELRDLDERTALWLALLDKKFDIAELLISFGADINSKFFFGASLLSQAIYNDDTAAVKFLKSKGAKDFSAKGQYEYEDCE